MAGVLAEVLVRWQHAAGPFWPYVCAAPFLGTGESEQLAQQALGTGSLRADVPARVTSRQMSLVNRLLAAAATDDPPLSLARERGSGGGGSPSARADEVSPVPHATDAPFSIMLADLPAEPLLSVAPLLAARGWYVVPVVQRWIASPAVLPCHRLVERLVRGAWQTRRPAQPRGAILLADGERTGPATYPLLVPGRTFDNRYEYQICRFPSTRFLEAQRVRRVHWITAARPVGGLGSSTEPMTLGLPPIARDLHPYREALLRAGIEVDVTVWQPS